MPISGSSLFSRNDFFFRFMHIQSVSPILEPRQTFKLLLRSRRSEVVVSLPNGPKAHKLRHNPHIQASWCKKKKETKSVLV